MSPQATIDIEHPPWQRSLFTLITPLQVAIVEAFLWVDRPLSAKLLIGVFDGQFPLNTVAYHVRRLVDSGVLVEDHTIPRRGALEHFHRLTS